MLGRRENGTVTSDEVNGNGTAAVHVHVHFKLSLSFPRSCTHKGRTYDRRFIDILPSDFPFTKGLRDPINRRDPESINDASSPESDRTRCAGISQRIPGKHEMHKNVTPCMCMHSREEIPSRFVKCDLTAGQARTRVSMLRGHRGRTFLP
jgi:hypothetical protein